MKLHVLAISTLAIVILAASPALAGGGKKYRGYGYGHYGTGYGYGQAYHPRVYVPPMVSGRAYYRGAFPPGLYRKMVRPYPVYVPYPTYVPYAEPYAVPYYRYPGRSRIHISVNF